MSGRRPLLLILLLASSLHAVGMARSVLPAQDGLKFIRVAKGFQTQPWEDVIRGTDQHPLYPMLVAMVEPGLSLFLGHGPDAWRISAQLISAVASLLMVVMVHALARRLFGPAIAHLAALGCVLLPLPMAVGHDTLSDSLALCAAMTALWLGVSALEEGGVRAAVACGIAAGIGYLARPEVLVVPLAVGLTGILHGLTDRRMLSESVLEGEGEAPAEPGAVHARMAHGPHQPDAPAREFAARTLAGASGWCGRRRSWVVCNPSVNRSRASASQGSAGASPSRNPALWGRLLTASPRLASLGIVFLSLVGTYALIKGEVSEKLALRQVAGLSRSHAPAVSRTKHWLPPGLDDPKWDFSPKEEPVAARPRLLRVLGDVGFQLAEGLGWILPLFVVWGFARDRLIRTILAEGGTQPDRNNTGRWLMAVFVLLFLLVLAQHEYRMGYLSSRHVLTLVIVTLPWAAGGIYVCAWRLAELLRLGASARRGWALALVTACVLVSVGVQLRGSHVSRWGHWAAGRWLASHARPGESVLDTRGWAAFVSGLPSYDYWHVRQAISDSSLSYVVVSDDELKAESPRGHTLRTLLAYAARPVASFPAEERGEAAGVWVYQYSRPESWEGMKP